MKKLLLTISLFVFAFGAKAQTGTATQIFGNGSYTNKLIVPKLSTKVYLVAGYNSGSAQFIQLFETNALPTNGSIPKISFPVGANQGFSADFSFYGINFDKLTICNSTTGDTLTLGSADCGLQAITSK